jgi:hypothetical protein
MVSDFLISSHLSDGSGGISAAHTPAVARATLGHRGESALGRIRRGRNAGGHQQPIGRTGSVQLPLQGGDALTDGVQVRGGMVPWPAVHEQVAGEQGDEQGKERVAGAWCHRIYETRSAAACKGEWPPGRMGFLSASVPRPTRDLLVLKAARRPRLACRG